MTTKHIPNYGLIGTDPSSRHVLEPAPELLPGVSLRKDAAGIAGKSPLMNHLLGASSSRLGKTEALARATLR